MHAYAPARLLLDSTDLVQGLAVPEVELRLQAGLRLKETGQRILAFYLVEMEVRGLHQDTGHSSTIHYASNRLGLDRRRAGELLAVGKKLLDLPAIDDAFRTQKIGWVKLVHLARVATPEHEGAWLDRALELTCQELALEVKLAKPGSPPRDAADRKGLPDPKFTVSVRIPALTHRKLEVAKEKLSAERAKPVGDAELLAVLAEEFLNTEEDGTVPGRKRIDASLYRIVLYEEPGAGGEEGDESEGRPRLLVDSDLGRVPIDGGEEDDPVARARSECVHCDGEGVHDLDVKTPPWLRSRVLARDGQRCRCCGSRHRVTVHHIEWRSLGGRTQAWNLVTLCVSCHALVHVGLLVLAGERARDVRFLDRLGRPLHEHGHLVELSVLMPLLLSQLDPAGTPLPESAPPPVTLDTVPDVVDRVWWQRHAGLVRFRSGKGLEFQAGVPLPEGDASTPRPSDGDAVGFEEAFRGLVGQEALVRRFETASKGSTARGRGFPHTLLVGPAGTGKTTLARRLATALGARLHSVVGPLVEDAPTLIRLLAGLGEGDVVFLDEAHAVPPSALETLYQALAEGYVDLTLHAGSRSRTVRFALPRFTLLAATTEDGKLHPAFRSRFGLQECLGFYADGALATLLTASSHAQGFTLDTAAAERLATFARGTPREALRLLDRVLDDAASRGTEGLDGGAVEGAMARLGYDRHGLAPIDQHYVGVLRESPGPVPLERLARTMGTSAQTLVKYVEPFLFRRGLVRMTPRGRVAVHRPRLMGA